MPGGGGRMPGGATTLATPLWRATGPPPIQPGVSRIVVGTPAVADTTAPITVYVSGTASRVSGVTGFDTDTISWTVDEDAQAWQVREVANAADSIGAAGQIVASGGPVAAGATQNTAIVSSSLTAGDGAKLLKIFAQDLAGNWSA